MRSIIAVAGVCIVAGAGPAFAGLLDDCHQFFWPDLQLRACEEIIVSPNFGTGEKAFAHSVLGEARTDAGALDLAVGNFTASIALNPNHMPALAGRAYAKFLKGDFHGAITDYNEAIRMWPVSSELYIERGHVLLASGNVEASIRDLTEAIHLDPNSASARNNRGLAYRKKGDNAHALEEYKAAIALNPVYALAYANRGYLHESQGNKREAIADLVQSLGLDPSQAEVRAALKRLSAEDVAGRESDRLVRFGRELAETNCSHCHAVGEAGASPNSRAPEFRNLYHRYRLLTLREPITRGIAAPHDQMPRFFLSDSDVDMIVAYINSLAVRK